MTLDKIRSNEELTKWWASVFNGKKFEPIAKMLQANHPMRYVDPGMVTASSAEKKLGMIEGYELALERLRLCAQFEQPLGELPPATFADPEFETDKE